MSGSLSTALAVAGTALMAVAIFGPFRKAVAVDDSSAEHASAAERVAHWPALVEATAIACDAATRIEIADALGALQSPWAAAILRQAGETEPDPAVRAAISSALSSSQSLVT